MRTYPRLSVKGGSRDADRQRSRLEEQVDPFALLLFVLDTISIDARLILLSPPHERCESHGERTSQRCSRVSNPWRNRRIRLSFDRTIPVQTVEGLAQNAERYPFDRSFQFTEAMRSSKQRWMIRQLH